MFVRWCTCALTAVGELHEYSVTFLSWGYSQLLGSMFTQLNQIRYWQSLKATCGWIFPRVGHFNGTSDRKVTEYFMVSFDFSQGHRTYMPHMEKHSEPIMLVWWYACAPTALGGLHECSVTFLSGVPSKWSTQQEQKATQQKQYWHCLKVSWGWMSQGVGCFEGTRNRKVTEYSGSPLAAIGAVVRTLHLWRTIKRQPA